MFGPMGAHSWQPAACSRLNSVGHSMSSPPPPHHHIFQNRSHSCAASLRAAVEQTPPSRRPGCWLAGAWAAMFDLKLLSGQPGQPAEQTSRIESTTGSAQGRRSQVGHFIEVWRWIWRYRLGCTHGAMHPLPMERDDSLWHPGLCWTSPAARAHLHKFVTSFWRVDRQTAASASAAVAFSTNCCSPTWSLLVQLAARLLRPLPSCLGLGSAPANWLRCCSPLPRSAKVHQVQILKGRLCWCLCLCLCFLPCCLLLAAPIVRPLHLVQLASYLATLHYLTLPTFPAAASVLPRHRNSTTSHLPGPSVLPRHTLNTLNTLNILCDFVQTTIDDN